MNDVCLTCDLLNSKKSSFSSLSSASRVIVDEDEPEVDVVDTPFEPRDVIGARRRRRFEEEFEAIDFLGRGRFGEVKRCREISSGAEFAAKFIATPTTKDRDDAEHEINIMRKLRNCRRLVQLYDVFENKNEVCLVLEIIYGGELFERAVSDDFMLTEKACVCFVRQICQGIAFMHSRNIIHLDMKPENILCLSRSGNRIKIIDFGLAREYRPGEETRVMYGTPEFMAPEVVQYDPVDHATDMWSLGVICYVLLSGLSPFMGDNDPDTMTNVANGHYDFHSPEFDNISDDAKDMISNLLQGDKKKRLSAEECLCHRWLQRTTQVVNISKDRLRQYVYRRKWQKAVNAMIALKRMGVDLKQLDSCNVRQRATPPSLFTEQLPPVPPTRKSHNVTLVNGVGLASRHHSQPPVSPSSTVSVQQQRPLVANNDKGGRSVVDDNCNIRSTLNQNKTGADDRENMDADVRRRYHCVVEQKVAPSGECNGNISGNNNNNVYSNNNNYSGPQKQHMNSTSVASTAPTVTEHSRLGQLPATSGDVTRLKSYVCDPRESNPCDCDQRTNGLSTTTRFTALNFTADKARSEAANSVGGSGGSRAGGSMDGARSKSSASSSTSSFGRRLNAIVRDRVIFFNQKDKTNGQKSSKTASSDGVNGRGGSKKSASSFISR